jgi:Domain of unknown function (DUF3846)
MSKLRMVLKEVGQVALGIETEDKHEHTILTVMQNTVGGFVEAVYPRSLFPLVLICNEDGMREELKPNLDLRGEIINRYVLGNVLVIGPADENGESQSLTPEEVEKAKKWLDERAVYGSPERTN